MGGDRGSYPRETSVARAILAALNHIPTVLILSQDAFYKKHTEEELQQAFNNDYDFGVSRCRSARCSLPEITPMQSTWSYLPRQAVPHV